MTRVTHRPLALSATPRTRWPGPWEPRRLRRRGGGWAGPQGPRMGGDGRGEWAPASLPKRLPGGGGAFRFCTGPSRRGAPRLDAGQETHAHGCGGQPPREDAGSRATRAMVPLSRSCRAVIAEAQGPRKKQRGCRASPGTLKCRQPARGRGPPRRRRGHSDSD